MTVTVVTPGTASSGRVSSEDVFADGDHIYAFEGHLAVTQGGPDDGTTIAIYAPGAWTSAHLDEHRKTAAPPGLGPLGR